MTGFARKLKKAALVLGAVLLLALIAHQVWTAVLRSRYEGHLDRIRASGYAVQPDDVASDPVPEERNVATALLRAHEWLKRNEEVLDEPEAFYRRDWSAWDDSDRAEVDRYLRSLKPYFDAVERALERPEFDAGLVWEQGVDLATPLIHVLEIASQQFWRLAVAPRQPSDLNARVVRAARVHLRLADRCPQPAVIGHMVTNSIRTGAVSVLRHVRDRSGLDAAHLRRELEGQLAAAEPPCGPAPAPLAESRVLGIWMCERVLHGESLSLLPTDYNAIHTKWYARPLVYLDALRFLDVMERAVEACDTTPLNAERIGIRFSEEFEGMAYPHLITILHSVQVPKHFRDFVVTVAALRIGRVALAVMEHRQRTGGWPARLQEIAGMFGGEVPTDPYTGRAFPYERNGERVRLYAVGPSELSGGGQQAWKFLEDKNLAWEWSE